jgi:hypothetical protein
MLWRVSKILSEVLFTQQPTWNFFGNCLVEAYVHGNKILTCKIWHYHCGDYEKCRLLGYKTPVRTSQYTHYVSATETNGLILCKICDFHGGDYEECRLLGCYAAWLL